MSDIRLNINGKEVVGSIGQTILQVAQKNDIEIPTLCYDERVEIYGSCGLCVVEVEGIPKLLRACATQIGEGMIIKTHTQKTKESRKMALELLLSDHTGDCRPPCVLACPGRTDCQGYVGLIANGEYKEALKLIKEQLPLPASIGRVCPHPCEDACRRQLPDDPISIAWLKSFVADIDLKGDEIFMPDIEAPTGKTVAIVGGGPAGLTAAYYLSQRGHSVTIYEAMPQMGGMLKYGIPQYRLPKDVLDKEIGIIEKMGTKMINNTKIGTDIELNYLRSNFDAVYIAIGAWDSYKLNCPGEELDGVLGGIFFLANVFENKPVNIGESVAIVGGGNVAMDACRTAVRLGAKKVYNIYRRTKEEMPAEEIEILEAEEEGVIFKFLVNPIEVIGEEGKVKKIRLQKMELGEPDKSGRRRPIPIEGEDEILQVDSVIPSIGQSVVLKGFEELTLTRKSTIHVDENSYVTNIPGVFAGGDAVGDNPRIAIQAIGDAKRAAEVICGYLDGETIPYKEPYYVTRDNMTEEDFEEEEKRYRPKMAHLSPGNRKSNFEEVVKGYTPEQAKEDAKRCLECGCHDFFECKLYQYSNEYEVKPERLSGEVHNRKVNNEHPFIKRDPDKCILCGLCVRVCDQVMGITALGLVDRGFDAIVKPALDHPLKETNCISCGQCVSVCPTGALQEKLLIEKPVPVETASKSTICSYCSVGCHLDIQTKGEMLVRALPSKQDSVSEGLLCSKGRFGYDMSQKGNRQVNPMIRKEGVLKEVSWDEALLYTAKKAQSIGMKYGGSGLAISVSDRFTNEEAYLTSKLGRDILKTDNICSFNADSHGIVDVLGYDASSNTFDELLGTDTIILIGSNVMKDHTIVGLKIKKAVARGAKLIVINPFESQADEWAYMKVTPDNSTNSLKQVLKALLDAGAKTNSESCSGLKELEMDLSSISVMDEAKEIAKLYGQSKRAMIVFDQKGVSIDGARLIADIAVVSGHIGRARSGIIQLKAKNNSQGLVDIGISKDYQEVVDGIAHKDIKGLMVFGEDVPGISLDGLEFLMVMDTHLTETASSADVFIPASGFAESRGTFTNAERRIQKLSQAIEPISLFENWEVLVKLSNLLGAELQVNSPFEIFAEIAKTVQAYAKADKTLDKGVVWPSNGSPVLYTEGFNFDDKKARLQAVVDGPIFRSITTTDYLSKSFEEFLMKELDKKNI